MEFLANMIRSCRTKRMKNDIERLPDEHLGASGRSRTEILTNTARPGTDASSPAASSYVRARKRQQERRYSWELD